MAAAAPKLLAEVRKERARRNAVRDKLLEGSSHAGGGEDDAEMRSKDGDDTSTTPRDGDKEKEKEKDTEGADRRESRELKVSSVENGRRHANEVGVVRAG